MSFKNKKGIVGVVKQAIEAHAEGEASYAHRIDRNGERMITVFIPGPLSKELIKDSIFRNFEKAEITW